MSQSHFDDQTSPILHDPSLLPPLEELDELSPFGPEELLEPEQNMAFSCPVDHIGTAVYVQGWARLHSEWPPVIFVHDLGENVELYETAARITLSKGFNTFSFDMRGHGRSTPLAGKMVSFDDLVNDLLQVVAWIRYKSQRRMPFLIGQGVGALILLHFQKAYPQYAQHCVLLAPVFQEQTALPLLSRMLIHTMAVLAPGARLPRFLLPYFLPLSDDANLRGSARTIMISAGFAQELLSAIRGASDAMQAIRAKNLVVCPIEDTFYNCARLLEQIREHPDASSFEVCQLPGISAQAMTHDPEEVERLFQALVPWMQAQVQRSPAI